MVNVVTKILLHGFSEWANCLFRWHFQSIYADVRLAQRFKDGTGCRDRCVRIAIKLRDGTFELCFDRRKVASFEKSASDIAAEFTPARVMNPFI